MLSGLENPFHILLLLVVVLLMFGAKRMPEMGRSLGHGMREFKDGILGREPAEIAGRSDSSRAELAEHSSPTDPAEPMVTEPAEPMATEPAEPMVTELAEPVAKGDGR